MVLQGTNVTPFRRDIKPVPQPGTAPQQCVIRSAPLRPADIAVAQNDLPASCATGPGPVAHPASCSMTSPASSVTVMIRPAADETITRGGRPLGQAVTSYVADGPASCKRGEELAVAAPACCKAFRTRRRDADGLHHHRHSRGGGGCWKVLELPFIQHVLTLGSLHGHV